MPFGRNSFLQRTTSIVTNQRFTIVAVPWRFFGESVNNGYFTGISGAQKSFVGSLL